MSMQSATAVIEPTVHVRGRVGRVIVKTMWTLALLMIGGAMLMGYLSLSLAQSAPQQAAAGAMYCFYAITPYMLARGFEALLR
jgi:preprotein translocase subunit SecG